MKTLFWIDAPEQAIQISKFKPSLDSVIVVTDPAAQERLIEGNITSTTPEDYLETNTFIALGMKQYETTDKLCHYIDQHLKKYEIFSKTNPLTPAAWHFTSLKILRDPLFLKAAELMAVIEKVQPEKIIYFQTKEENIAFNGFFSLNQESLYAHLIPLLAPTSTKLERRSIVFSSSPNIASPEPSKHWYSGLRKIGFLRKIRSSQRLLGWKGWFLSLLRPSDSGLALLTLNTGHDLPYVLKSWNKKNAGRILYWGTFEEPDPFQIVPATLFPTAQAGETFALKVQKPASMAWEALQSDAEFLSFFKYRDIDLFPIFRRYLKFFFLKIIPASAETYFRAERLFETSSIKAVITTCLSDPRDAAIFDAALHKGIPRIISSHGPYGLPPALMPNYHDYRRCDHFLAWGEGSAVDIRKFDPIKPRIHIVGSAKLDQMKTHLRPTNSTNSTTKKIVFVTFPILKNINYISSRENTRDFHVYATQKQVLTVFKDFPNIPFIIKLFPNILIDDPLPLWAAQKGISNCTFTKWTPFIDLLSEIDWVIMDYYCTPLVEALAAKKGVIVFHREPIEEELSDLASSVYCVKNEEALRNILRRIQEDPQISLPRKAEAFLKKYGTAQDDGASAERAANAIQKIMSGT